MTKPKKSKPKFILRRTENHARAVTWHAWDIMRVYKNGEEFIAEFEDHFEDLARKAVRALNGKVTR